VCPFNLVILALVFNSSETMCSSLVSLLFQIKPHIDFDKKNIYKKKVEGTIENNKLPGSIHDRSSQRDVMKIGETICILTWVSTVQRVTWAIRHCAWKACPHGKT
jgi:hypothetical protein